MATGGSDSDVRSAEQDLDGRSAAQAHHEYTQESSRKSQTSHKRQSERTVRITEVTTEQFQGLDELSSCINSMDDHVQAGLQELRNCVANLKKEKSNVVEKVRTLTEEMHRISLERDHYQLAVEELQQEVLIVREQLQNQQQDKEVLFSRIQDIESKNEEHLASIAEKQRSRRLAHKAVSCWRKKTLNKKLECNEKLVILEEENKALRAELLLCQEAAKEAFLRSANVLNSEAITMFQDAATRRLGCEGVCSCCCHESQSSLNSSILNSSGSCTHGHQKSNASGGGNGIEVSNKENIETCEEGNRKVERKSQSDVRVEIRNEGVSGSEDDRSYIAAFGSENHSKTHTFHGITHHEEVNQREQGTFVRRGSHESFNLISDDVVTDSGQIPPLRRHMSISSFNPDTLQQESRAYLQQLRDERRKQPDPGAISGFESRTKAQKMASSQTHHRHKTCTCKSRKATTEFQGPYRCPYCTPIHSSQLGHVKDIKKHSNATRCNVLSSTNKGKKKVVYTPSASTIVIEKHITR